MASKLASSVLRKTATTSAPAAPAAEPVQAQAPPAEVEQDDSSDEVQRRQRQSYEPKSVLEYEKTTTEICELLRRFKTRLYPTTAPKATVEQAPTRREFDELISKINGLKRDYKSQSRKAESRPKRKVAVQTGKPKNGGFKNPCVVDEQLANFIATHFNTDGNAVIDETRICTRALLTSMLTQYAYDRNLRDNENPTKIKPDSVMKALFKTDFEEAGVDVNGFPHTHMQKLLTRHVMPAEEFKAHLAKHSITDAGLEEYKAHLESIQARFKDEKLRREAARPPKVAKKASTKKEE